MEVTVCVGTFGDPDWTRLAQRRAVPSAERQAPVIHVHGKTLADARNAAIEQATTEWIVCLDADDELAPGFIAAMRAAEHLGDLLGPAVSYVRNGRAGRPKVWPQQDLRDGNHLVIGTAVRRELILGVGGFQSWPLYEDWAVWQLCAKAGAAVVSVPEAVYIAHVRRESRNRAPSREERLYWHHEIRRANYPELYEAAA